MFAIKRQLFVCCYDISDDKARKSVHRVVRSFACGGQKSAYECFLSPSEAALLLAMTQGSLADGDNLVLQPISTARDIVTLGCASKPVNLGFCYLG
ncbi:TPA: CRISPR-associated endonuclease Cas2 [Aeromonas veronii]|jgi:CRISPR-associated protein Cas2|uniref:CRISPR-associated endonuclease Cas2 n=1 Tax=Aeromonas sp. QDB56 TaxID=2990495 RepID=UPI0022E88AC0|nr:CRISPR-associated endonuclease Cas2 [Aeromonas sp. QDB56]